MPLSRKLLLISIAVVAVGRAFAYTAFELSPWPAVLLIRHTFEERAKATQDSIASLTPKDVVAHRRFSYASGDRDARFDV